MSHPMMAAMMGMPRPGMGTGGGAGPSALALALARLHATGVPHLNAGEGGRIAGPAATPPRIGPGARPAEPDADDAAVGHDGLPGPAIGGGALHLSRKFRAGRRVG